MSAQGVVEVETGGCPKCGGEGLVPRIEPNQWGL